MPTLTIRHLTTYRYRRPVAFGEHRMMLRPRDTPDQMVLEASVKIDPEPDSLRFVQDAYGNHLGIVRFVDRSEVLSFESTVRLERSPPNPADLEIEGYAGPFPFDYSAEERLEFAFYMERQHPDPGDEVGRWASRFPPPPGAFELLTALTEGIHRDFGYRRREEKGIQDPQETLRLGHGSCRDFAVLMIEAARSLGFAARFASGYLAVPLDYSGEPASSSARGSTHAWAQVYLPRTGWIDFDPTSGKSGNRDLVTVAVVRDPHDAIPLHGTFIGLPSDHLGMDVEVSITRGAPEAVLPAP